LAEVLGEELEEGALGRRRRVLCEEMLALVEERRMVVGEPWRLHHCGLWVMIDWVLQVWLVKWAALS
jgi:hypothetical protein